MDFVVNNNLISPRVSEWQLMEDVELKEFQRLTHDLLRDLTLGEYQIRQAAGYNTEVEDLHGDREFYIARVNRTLLSLLKIKTRQFEAIISVH